jgi:hypothetical protein
MLPEAHRSGAWQICRRCALECPPMELSERFELGRDAGFRLRPDYGATGWGGVGFRPTREDLAMTRT